MARLEEKVVNCFDTYLKNLNYGKASKPSKLLYDAILYLRNRLDNDAIEAFLYNNLRCKNNIKLTETSSMKRVLSVTLSPSEEPLSTFIWKEYKAPVDADYTLTTTSTPGFNFVYISVPQDKNFIITNALGHVLFNSLLIPSEQNFTLAGTVRTTKGQTNAVYRGNNIFNGHNPVKFIVKLF
jgi:hypothetical protein